jgi:hypothetical protein
MCCDTARRDCGGGAGAGSGGVSSTVVLGGAGGASSAVVLGGASSTVVLGGAGGGASSTVVLGGAGGCWCLVCGASSPVAAAVGTSRRRALLVPVIVVGVGLLLWLVGAAGAV